MTNVSHDNQFTTRVSEKTTNLLLEQKASASQKCAAPVYHTDSSASYPQSHRSDGDGSQKEEPK